MSCLNLLSNQAVQQNVSIKWLVDGGNINNDSNGDPNDLLAAQFTRTQSCHSGPLEIKTSSTLESSGSALRAANNDNQFRSSSKGLRLGWLLPASLHRALSRGLIYILAHQLAVAAASLCLFSGRASFNLISRPIMRASCRRFASSKRSQIVCR